MIQNGQVSAATSRAAAAQKSARSEARREIGDASSGEYAMSYCPRCSTRLEGRSCKLICPACNYYMSCSDFY